MLCVKRLSAIEIQSVMRCRLNERQLTIHGLLVQFIDAFIAVDHVHVLLLRIFDLTDLILSIDEIPECFEISWYLWLFGQRA